jgi:hypothetical protein
MMLYWECICQENGQSLVWTSMLRPKGPLTSLHHPRNFRAVDFRVFNTNRKMHPTHALGGCHHTIELHDGERFPMLETMVSEFKQAFGLWLGTDYKKHEPIILHGEGLNFHGHMQCKPIGGGWV